MPVTTLSLAALQGKFIAVPVMAALAIGTGAAGAYMTQPTPVSAPAISEAAVAAPVVAPVPCAQQTWPYIESRCAESNAASRSVRMVMTPSQSDAANLMGAVPAPQAAIEEANKSILMTSRDTVLRGSELAPTPKAAAPKVSVTKPRAVAKRAEPRQERRFATQSYQVPAEFGERSRAIMVVRPMRTESYD
jgi:hypothetical protein